MSLRRSLWITAVAVGCVAVPASAETTPTSPQTANQTYTRTFVFPPVGLAATETAQISVLNIAPDAHNGTKASCSGTISFANGAGVQFGAITPFTDLGTNKIGKGQILGFSPSNPTGRSEIQGTVQLTVELKPLTPCSLLLTLETFDTNTGVTHAVVTTAVETTPQNVPVRIGDRF
ncbi:MAG: hypothetical protein LAP40_08040 [Acidobacteriia bacterium]|nr:hypothetical protein [Terriglobia bacterium]